IRDLKGLRRAWFEIGATPQYYPLVFTSFWIEYHLGQSLPAGEDARRLKAPDHALDPIIYHVDNTILHTASAILLWLILSRLAVPGAWLAAAIFAVHPVHVESVAWITERKNVLSAFFYLSAFLAYLHFDRLEGEPSDIRKQPPWGWYIAALLCFVCALLS